MLSARPPAWPHPGWSTLGQLPSGLSFMFLTCHTEVCHVRTCMEAPCKLSAAVQLGCGLVYRLRCYNKETPNTGLNKGQVSFSLHSSPQPCLCARALFTFSWVPARSQARARLVLQNVPPLICTGQSGVTRPRVAPRDALVFGRVSTYSVLLWKKRGTASVVTGLHSLCSVHPPRGHRSSHQQ